VIEKEDEELTLLMHEVVSDDTRYSCTKVGTEKSSELRFR
jgi:hypothetical protein